MKMPMRYLNSISHRDAERAELEINDLNKITEKIIGCAIEVHRNLGPGLLESVYEKALIIELQNIGLKYEQQKTLKVMYKGNPIGEFVVDILVEGKVVLELKSVERPDPVFDAQKLSLLINFNKKLLKEGIKRVIL